MADLNWWPTIDHSLTTKSQVTLLTPRRHDPIIYPVTHCINAHFFSFQPLINFEKKNDFPFSYSSFSVLYVFSLFSLTLDIRTRNLVDNPKSQTHTGCNKQLQKLVTKKAFISAEKFFFYFWLDSRTRMYLAVISLRAASDLSTLARSESIWLRILLSSSMIRHTIFKGNLDSRPLKRVFHQIFYTLQQGVSS